MLAATSNPEAKGLQAAITANGQSVASGMVGFALSHNSESFGSVGLVVGADTDLEDLGINPSSLTSTPLLIPGFGAQGSSLKDVRVKFGEASRAVLCSVSRSVAGVSVTGLRGRILLAKSELEEGLAS